MSNFNSFTDLHLHLDGSLSVSSVRSLAKLQNIQLDSDDEKIKKLLQVEEGCRDLNEYLTKFAFPCSLLQTREALTLCVKNLLGELSSQKLKYAEIRFAPQLHIEKGLSQDEVVKAAVEGLKDSPIEAKLILCCMRGSDNEKKNFETLNVAKEWLNKGVCAVDLAGAEALFPTSTYAELFKTANSLGLPYTIHAGEADGPESIYKAIEFGARRIGHGVRSIEDKDLVKTIAREKIPLELCPTSNIQTCIFKSMDEYPVMKLLDAGVITTINTDNMAVSNTTVEKELLLLQKAFSLSDNDVKELQSYSDSVHFA